MIIWETLKVQSSAGSVSLNVSGANTLNFNGASLASVGSISGSANLTGGTIANATFTNPIFNEQVTVPGLFSTGAILATNATVAAGIVTAARTESNVIATRGITGKDNQKITINDVAQLNSDDVITTALTVQELSAAKTLTVDTLAGSHSDNTEYGSVACNAMIINTTNKLYLMAPGNVGVLRIVGCINDERIQNGLSGDGTRLVDGYRCVFLARSVSWDLNVFVSDEIKANGGLKFEWFRTMTEAEDIDSNPIASATVSCVDMIDQFGLVRATVSGAENALKILADNLLFNDRVRFFNNPTIDEILAWLRSGGTMTTGYGVCAHIIGRFSEFTTGHLWYQILTTDPLNNPKWSNWAQLDTSLLAGRPAFLIKQ